MIEMIQRLIDGGHAYVAPDGTVYYRVRSFEGYGKLSHKNVEENQSGLRTLKVTGEEAKEDPNDFVLWKPKKEGEPFWESPWCEGRPGWHIECSVMSKKYLGEQLSSPIPVIPAMAVSSRRSAPTIPVSLPPRSPSMLTAPASGSRLALSPLRPFVLC